MTDISQSDTGMSDAPVMRGWPHWLTRRQACHDHRRDGHKVKWSGEIGQGAKMYPTRTNGYENDEETELFRQV